MSTEEFWAKVDNGRAEVEDEQRRTIEFRRAFGDSFKQARARRGWTAEEAAARAGMASKTYQRVEDGKPVRNETFQKLDRLFNLTPGASLRSWHDENILELEGISARAHQNIEADRSAAHEQLDIPQGSYVERLVNQMRNKTSDKSAMIQLVTRLVPFAEDPRIRELMRGLTPVAFAGIINEWDIYDEKGNLNIPPSADFTKVDLPQREPVED